jgi:hypothetical protein
MSSKKRRWVYAEASVMVTAIAVAGTFDQWSFLIAAILIPASAVVPLMLKILEPFKLSLTSVLQYTAWLTTLMIAAHTASGSIYQIVAGTASVITGGLLAVLWKARRFSMYRSCQQWHATCTMCQARTIGDGIIVSTRNAMRHQESVHGGLASDIMERVNPVE